MIPAPREVVTRVFSWAACWFWAALMLARFWAFWRASRSFEMRFSMGEPGERGPFWDWVWEEEGFLK